MNTDLAAQLIAAQGNNLRQSVQVAVMRKAQQAEQQILTLIDDGAANLQRVAPLPDGVGRTVDRSA